MTDVDVAQWSAELDRLHARIAGRFTRSEPRRRAWQYLSGLVAGLDRTNGWTLAEQAGDLTPDGMQRLLRWADWDVDAVRDDVRDYVIEHLGDPDGVLIIDDTGFLKKGAVLVEATARSGGVQMVSRALDLKRPAMVVPGPVTSAMSAGCHTVLRAHAAARLVTSAGEVITELSRTSH